MRRVIKVVAGGHLAVIEVDDGELDTSFVKSNIGTSDGKSWMEATRFVDGIDIVCDEEGKLKNLLPSMKLRDDVIAGDCIILSREIINDDDEQGWMGLNEQQFDFVIEKLLFLGGCENE